MKEMVLDLSGGRVDITDPCYDRDVWCRIDGLSVKPGTYRCGYSKSRTGRIRENFIVHSDYSFSDYGRKDWKRVGEIGVDAGLAGFFADKPDYDDKAWNDLCDYMSSCDKDKSDGTGVYSVDDKSFWTCSGFGDGGYDVYAVKVDNEIVALKIVFLWY